MAYDYYKILGIGFSAPASEIKRSFREKAKRFHPDTSSESDAHAYFQVLNEAYQTLMDPAKRRQYDAKMGYAADPVFQAAPLTRAEKREERRRRNAEFSADLHRPPGIWDPPAWVKYFFYGVGLCFGTLVSFFSLFSIWTGEWSVFMGFITILGLMVLIDSISGFLTGNTLVSDQWLSRLRK